MFFSKTTNFAMNIFDAVCTECGGWNSASMTKKIANYHGNAGRRWILNVFSVTFSHFGRGRVGKFSISTPECYFTIYFRFLATIRTSLLVADLSNVDFYPCPHTWANVKQFRLLIANALIPCRWSSTCPRTAGHDLRTMSRYSVFYWAQTCLFFLNSPSCRGPIAKRVCARGRESRRDRDLLIAVGEMDSALLFLSRTRNDVRWSSAWQVARQWCAWLFVCRSSGWQTLRRQRSEPPPHSDAKSGHGQCSHPPPH